MGIVKHHKWAFVLLLMLFGLFLLNSFLTGDAYLPDEFIIVTSLVFAVIYKLFGPEIPLKWQVILTYVIGVIATVIALYMIVVIVSYLNSTIGFGGGK